MIQVALNNDLSNDTRNDLQYTTLAIVAIQFLHYQYTHLHPNPNIYSRLLRYVGCVYQTIRLHIQVLSISKREGELGFP